MIRPTNFLIALSLYACAFSEAFLSMTSSASRRLSPPLVRWATQSGPAVNGKDDPLGSTTIHQENYDIVKVDLEDGRDYPIYIGTGYSDQEGTSDLHHTWQSKSEPPNILERHS
jgi:hypothetical protein